MWWGLQESVDARGPQVSLDLQDLMDLPDPRAAPDSQVLLVLWGFMVSMV